MEALAFARSLGLVVAINIIADPSWDHARFAALRAWCMEIPEIVNVSVATPYPGTEIWQADAAKLSSRDYRLFDIQHAVMPTALPRSARDARSDRAIANWWSGRRRYVATPSGRAQ